MPGKLKNIDWSGRVVVWEQAFRLRPKTIASLRRYLLRGIIPTGFVRYMLANDLKAVVCKVSMFDFMEIPVLAWWLHQYAPNESWGSVGSVADWSRARERDPWEVEG